MTGKNKNDIKIDELIQYVTLHTTTPVILSGSVLPFFILYSLWFYSWAFIYGIEEYWEAGLVSLAVIACGQILCCLCCFWSVHIQTFLNCRKVCKIFQKKKK